MPEGPRGRGWLPSSLRGWLRRRRPAGLRFAPGAWRLAAIPLLVGLVATPISGPVGLAVLALGAGVLVFFRDPDRAVPDAGIVAPADGRVSVLREEGDRLRVGVFMNITDVHVNRAPLAGTVETLEHHPGANRPAFTKDSERNERVEVDLGDWEFSQIAGWFARRIHPYVEPGDRVERGQRVGHIAFGSRADVLLPPEVEAGHLRVAQGDRVRAGETVIAVPPDSGSAGAPD